MKNYGLLKQLYIAVVDRLPPKPSLKVQFFRNHGVIPNIDHPRTFNEFIQNQKVYSSDPRFSRLADKEKVKHFVTEKLGDGWVVPTLWVGRELPPREERAWPVPFVMKTTHSSKANIFVRDAADIDWDAFEEKLTAWLQSGHPRHLHETHYRNIEPAVIVEPWIGDKNTFPPDYRFFCFGGRIMYISVDFTMSDGVKRVFFNTSWEKQDFRLRYEFPEFEVAKPASLRKMIFAAELLSKDFEHVRVDFYEIDGQPLIGELTFAHASGYQRFIPRSVDTVFGEAWRDARSRLAAKGQV